MNDVEGKDPCELIPVRKTNGQLVDMLCASDIKAEVLAWEQQFPGVPLQIRMDGEILWLGDVAGPQPVPPGN